MKFIPWVLMNVDWITSTPSSPPPPPSCSYYYSSSFAILLLVYFIPPPPPPYSYNLPTHFHPLPHTILRESKFYTRTPLSKFNFNLFIESLPSESLRQILVKNILQYTYILAILKKFILKLGFSNYREVTCYY